jgi:hypothetical protein
MTGARSICYSAGTARLLHRRTGYKQGGWNACGLV